MGENVMQGSGLYNEHSVQQAEAAEAGVALLRAAAGEISLPDDGPIVVADYGASEGTNSLRPLRAALGEIRSATEADSWPRRWCIRTFPTTTSRRCSRRAAAAPRDWEAFLRLRSAELRSGGELVVTTLASGPGYSSG